MQNAYKDVGYIYRKPNRTLLAYTNTTEQAQIMRGVSKGTDPPVELGVVDGLEPAVVDVDGGAPERATVSKTWRIVFLLKVTYLHMLVLQKHQRCLRPARQNSQNNAERLKAIRLLL